MNEKCGSKEIWIGSALLLAPLVVLCVQFLDVPVGLYVKEELYGNRHWSRLTSTLPDLLLLVVLVTSFTGLSLYFVRSRKGLFDAATKFDKHVAWAAPVAYVTKDLLKFVFGRVNTRIWVDQPELYGFNWFHGRSAFQGFPSGHMLVMVTIFAAFWRFYPGTRAWCLVVATMLGAALILTNYHFVSDVLAGAYLGVVVEAVMYRVVAAERRGLGSSAIQ